MRLPQGVRQLQGEDFSRKTYPHMDLTRQIIGCAVEVHRALGPGFLEPVYEQAMLHELVKSGLGVEQQKSFVITYGGVTAGEHRADLVVDGAVIVELKGRRRAQRHTCGTGAQHAESIRPDDRTSHRLQRNETCSWRQEGHPAGLPSVTSAPLR